MLLGFDNFLVAGLDAQKLVQAGMHSATSALEVRKVGLSRVNQRCCLCLGQITPDVAHVFRRGLVACCSPFAGLFFFLDNHDVLILY